MKLKRRVLFLVMFLITLTSYAQQQTQLRGNVIDAATNQPMPGVTVSIIGQSNKETTDANGNFFFMSVSPGLNELLFSSNSVLSRKISINAEANAITLLKDIKLVMSDNDSMNQASMIDELAVDDDNDGSSQNISSMVIMSNDTYLKNIGYNLSAMRFKVRGYTNNYEQKFINGVSFNDQYRGVFNYSSIGALNDLTRNGDVVNYNGTSTFTYGGIAGAENINMRASTFAKGGKVSASYTNRNYYLRGMATYSTGLRDDGWAMTLGIGGRYSDEGSIDGTFYQNVSYALSIEKQWAEGKHSLSFVTYGSPVKRGQQGASFQEAYDLLGNNLYNPNWGYDGGKKRNAKVVKSFDPTMIASHIWKINDKVTLTTGLGAHYSRYGNTALNWYDGQDPRPDYYRKLPSYYDFEQFPAMHNDYVDRWRYNSSTSQVDWDRMYQANRTGEVNEQTIRDGRAAVYMVEERRSDLHEGTLNSTVVAKINPNYKITAGIGARATRSSQFKTVDDLLGADYALDIDKFAERDFKGPDAMDIIQNDQRPGRYNRKVYKGDTFGYDYRINVTSANAWIQNEYTTNHVDAYYSAKVAYTAFQRRGYMRNGRNPNTSLGKGKTHDFVDFGLKGGLTYKFNGRHFLRANIGYETQAPLAHNAYLSPRTTDMVTKQGLESEKILSMDLSYVFSLPSFSGRVTVYQTNFFDKIKKISYYHDSQKTFINHVLTGLDQTNRGIEVGLAYKLDDHWSFDFGGTISENYYSNNPMGTISYENGKSPNDTNQREVEEKVYLKDYYVGSTPQIAGTFGVHYFNSYWFLGANVNVFGRNYIDIAPIRRVASNYQFKPGQAGIDPSNPADMETYNKLTNQERYGTAYTIDLSIGKMFYLRGGKAINFNLAVNNVLNRKNIKTGGYESGRIDLSYPDKFNAKYYYMQGINCFFNTSFRF